MGSIRNLCVIVLILCVIELSLQLQAPVRRKPGHGSNSTLGHHFQGKNKPKPPRKPTQRGAQKVRTPRPPTSTAKPGGKKTNKPPKSPVRPASTPRPQSPVRPTPSHRPPSSTVKPGGKKTNKPPKSPVRPASTPRPQSPVRPTPSHRPPSSTVKPGGKKTNKPSTSPVRPTVPRPPPIVTTPKSPSSTTVRPVSLEHQSPNGINEDTLGWDVQTRKPPRSTIPIMHVSNVISTRKPRGNVNHAASQGQSCTIDIKDVRDFQPLIVNPRDINKFIYPDKNRKIVIKHGSSIYLVCSGSKNVFKNFLLSFQYLTFDCESGSFKPEYQNQLTGTYKFDEIFCKNNPEPVSKASSMNPNTKSMNYYKIGFETDAHNGFIPLLDIYYNSTKHLTSYVKNHLSKLVPYPRYEAWINHYKKSPYFLDKYVKDNIGKTTLDDMYHKKNKPLEESLQVDRGHLAPKGDMVYIPEGDATYNYLNVVPQWRTINHGNWKKIEEFVRRKAKNSKKDLTIITGSYIDERQANRMYLYRDSKIEVPIPNYIYKIVYDPIDKRGIVFVTANDLNYDSNVHNAPCSETVELKNLELNMLTSSAGHTYICTVKSFLARTNIELYDEERDFLRNIKGSILW